MASKKAFSAAELVAYPTIARTVAAFNACTTDFALVPIENSLEGTVTMTVDALYHTTEKQAVAEFVFPIKQCLLAAATDRKLTTIVSHPQALAQVAEFLSAHFPDVSLRAMDSTAQAAAYVREHPDDAVAAIAPKEAAATYGLQILAEGVQDSDENFTRFWLLGNETPVLSALTADSQKVTLALTPPQNVSGVLHQALSVFAWRKLQLTKIESRPLKTRLGEYFFVVDLEQDEKISYAIQELESLGFSVKQLGAYSVYKL
jgi:prephenate dehydratase